MRSDREPAGNGWNVFLGTEHVIERFVREYMATSATISMTFASV